VHRYEGYSVKELTFPVRLLRALGVQRLLLTNAAGGINPNFLPGSLMFITDHITLETLRISPAEDRCTSRLVSRDVYDAEWTARGLQSALDLGIQPLAGVYLWTTGPNYETPAEVRAFGLFGADVVGMSTVPEAVQAHILGMKVLGVSLITNCAAGLHNGSLTHDEVLDTAARMHSRLTHLVRRIIGLKDAT
jgi:purine-nucleoside phosphorylase